MSNNHINQLHVCASCGRPGHARNTHRLCPNNSRNQQSTTASPNSDTLSQNFNEIINNIANITTTATESTNNRRCICGSTTHSRTNHTHCPLNRNRNNININQIQPNDENSIQSQITPITTETTILSRCRCGSTTHSRPTHINCPLSQGFGYNSGRQTITLPDRHRLNEMNVRCSHCSALMWIEEKTSGSRNDPAFTLCCNSGNNMAAPLYDTPVYIRHLLQNILPESRHFKSHIRSYNNAFSFTSLGVNLDSSVQTGGGPFCFRIHGTMYHRIGSVLPEPNNPPRFAQVYIYDRSEENQINIRHNNVSGLNRLILATIEELMHTLPNPYVNMFLTMKRYIDMNPNEVHNIRFILRAENTPDARRYNTATNDNEIAVLIVGGDNDQQYSSRDVVLRPLDGGNLQVIDEKHRSYDSLGYPLIFPRGEDGWHIRFTSLNGEKLTPRQLYSYRLMYRNNNNSLHLFGNLFHQYIVDMYAKIEQHRLSFIYHNQSNLRAEQYQGLMDAIVLNDNDLRSIGRRVILPSTFIGAPRHMSQLYQDAISIVSRLGRPDLFITFTCNPKWPEIQSALLFGQTAGDRPDLCARVFQIKLDCLMDDLLKKHILGRVIAHIRVIEFQKRGLPHAHILLILDAQDKPRTNADYDSIVSAEIPDGQQHNLAYLTVVNNMMHGPCGVHNPNARCMENNQCSKGFPKAFFNETHTQNSGYPEYRRRDDGRSFLKNGVRMDNRWVVPHNIFLCTKYDAHINVEVCTTISVVKYLYKYVYKGHDRARMQLLETSEAANNAQPPPPVNEINMFLDARYVSAPEACWRIFSFSLHHEYPSHQRLAVHLPNQETVYFNENAEVEDIMNRARIHTTTLLAWFQRNSTDANARNYRYIEFPEHYVWDQRERKWNPRRRGFGGTIGRMYLVSPRQNERYFLRLLLLHVRGATGFENLRTVNGVIHPTFQTACRALGLLESDEQWDNCLNEAAEYRTPYMLRQLFVTILLFCEPSNPHQLWLNHRDNLSEDYISRHLQSVTTPQIDLTEQQKMEAYNNCLLDINDLLETQGSNLNDVEGFTFSRQMDTRRAANDPLAGLTREEARQRLLIMDALDAPNPHQLPFNAAQQHAFSKIIEACYNENRQTSLFFVDGPGGTGKTYLFNALLNAIRRKEDIAIAVASSGTASLLLTGGRTAHSTFHIPIKVTERSMCDFTPRHAAASIIKNAKLIIWDEASMINSDVLKCVDRSFRDLMRLENPLFNEIPFGGKLIVFGGDFRQVLPVVPRGSKADIINQCINQTNIWNEVQRLRLTDNMRVMQALSENNTELANHLQQFSNFLLSIGDGSANTINNNQYAKIPDDMILTEYTHSELSRRIYNNFASANDVSPVVLAGRAVLAATNSHVNDINQELLESFRGEQISYRSIDTILDPNEALTYPVEFLNSISISSLPPHTLILKMGVPIMTLRNISFDNGICNGTRLIVTGLTNNLIRATVITGPNKGASVLIPKIRINSDEEQCGVKFQRLQFPIRLAFAMTINKAQGQTLDSVGLYLPSPVFGHGQLYVALSRAKRPEDIKIMLDRVASRFPPNEGLYTANIVYREVLH